ncbi:hypothetical protein [Luteococcus peritonei]|uniref:Transglutaminase-like domain-containing protein n=1 Tax=Luteococcus peritonei TaxID=88874 RepID=A0ABW4RT93_9ACTN
MSRTSRTLALTGASAALLAPALLTAPRPTGPGLDVEQVTSSCRASGLAGWELVDRATRSVHDGFTHHSLWHLWESPTQALRHGRGWSGQYNRALAQVLRSLGFQVVVVHASRVRGLGRNPWWQTGHTWLQVTHQGRTLDVCASRPDNRAGQVGFVPMTQVRPVHPWTREVVTAALVPVVAVEGWRMLLGGDLPRWLYRGFDEPL